MQVVEPDFVWTSDAQTASVRRCIVLKLTYFHSLILTKHRLKWCQNLRLDQLGFTVFQREAGGARARYALRWEISTAATGWVRPAAQAADNCGKSEFALTAAPKLCPIRQTEHRCESSECPGLCSCALAMPCEANSNSNKARRRLRPKRLRDICMRVFLACLKQ